MFWRSIPSLQTLLAAGMGLLMLEIVMAHQPAQAESCTVDPFGSEVCLPDSTPEEPDQAQAVKSIKEVEQARQVQTNGDRAVVLWALYSIPACSAVSAIPGAD
jgi:hypothetical protein